MEMNNRIMENMTKCLSDATAVDYEELLKRKHYAISQ
jgi:hypothetical protein